MKDGSVPFFLLLIPCAALAQSPAERQEDEAVGASINYVFATDLGSGVYDLDGRTLQIYQFTWRKDLRPAREGAPGLRFELPLTFGFFDFSPVDVLSSGLPKRVDSFTVAPGLELDYLLRDGWHLAPYARVGFSVASSSVNGWIYGAGVTLERTSEVRGWDARSRAELAFAGVSYRHETPNDEFARLRQGFDLTRGVGWPRGGRELEVGVYAMFDLILDPPTVPLEGAREAPVQAELGVTFATRPRFKIWRFDAPRLGLGYRLAGDLSAWRLVFGKPF